MYMLHIIACIIYMDISLMSKYIKKKKKKKISEKGIWWKISVQYHYVKVTAGAAITHKENPKAQH